MKEAPAMMRAHLVPHYIIIGVFILIILIGLMTNSGAIGQFLGGIIAMSIDPAIFGTAILVGLLTRRHSILVATLILVSIVVEYKVTQDRLGIGLEPTWTVTIAYRVAAAILCGYLVNLVAEAARALRDRAYQDE